MTRKTWFLSLAVLAAATFTAFLPVLGNGFVWDDGANLIHNPHLDKAGFDLFRWAFSEFGRDHYQPLTWLSLALDRALWGPWAAGYHLTNLLLHVATVLLFAVLAYQLLAEAVGYGTPAERAEWWPPSAAVGDGSRSGDWGRVWIAALIAAAVFALHPMRVESVAWVTERRDVLAGLFFFPAILAYLQMVRCDREKRSRLAWWLTALILFTLSLLCKALALGLPVVLLVLDVYPLRRWRPGDGWSVAVRLLVEKVPFFLVSIVFGLVALAVAAESDVLVAFGHHGWVERLFQAAYGAMFYPRAMLSVEWSPLYERPTVLDPLEPRFLLSMLAFVGVTAALVIARRRFPAGLAVWLAYLALLAPVSGIAQSGIQLVADRYAYFSGLGFALLAGALWEMSRRYRRPAASAAVTLVVVAILASWAVLTWRQSQVWKDDATLWRHVVAFAPSAMGYNNLGALAIQNGERATALRFLTRSVETGPAFGLPWRNLSALIEPGVADLDRADLQGAAEALQASLPYHEHAATAWTTLALVRLALNERDAALANLVRAVEVNPDYNLAWRLLGTLQLGDRRHGECQASFAASIRLEPRDAGTWTALGLCRQGSGDREGALAAFERALQLNPGAAAARRGIQELRGEG